MVYCSTFVIAPCLHKTSLLKTDCTRNAQEKRHKHGWEREGERMKKSVIKSQKGHAHTFLNDDPCAVTFHMIWYLIVSDCIVLFVYFRFDVSSNRSDAYKCGTRAVNIQPLPDF